MLGEPRRGTVAAVAIGLALALVSPARAQTGGVEDPDVEIARRHFERGSERYAAGDYAAALTEFREAQRYKPSPALVYNIARCQDRMERTAEALASYERYQAEAPGNPEVAQRITVLRQRLAEQTAPPAPSPPTATPTVTRAPPRRASIAAPAAVGGVAVASLATALGLYLSAAHDYADVQASCPYDCPSARWSSLRTRADASYGLFAVAGAAAVVDVGLWVWWARHHRGGSAR